MYKFGLKKITNTTQYIEYQRLNSTRNHNTLLYHEYCHENQTDRSTSGERELEEDLPQINHELVREPEHWRERQHLEILKTDSIRRGQKEQSYKLDFQL